MTQFAFVVIVYLVIDAFAKVAVLATGGSLHRQPWAMALDAVINVSIAMWGVYLIARP